MKLRNAYFANMKVGFITGQVEFDANGVGDVQPDEFAEKLLAMPKTRYHKVDVEPEVVELGEPTEEDVEVVEIGEEPKEESKNIEKMTGKELDAYAKELKIEDYPKDANVGTRRAAIGAFLKQ